MQSGLSPRSLSNPAALVGFVAVVVVALWAIYGIWIRNADLRPVTQTTEAAGVNSCMDRYAAAPADDKAAQINLLWSIYYLCDAMISRKLLYEEQVIRNENFVFQRYENTIIMLMVVSITISGVILAGIGHRKQIRIRMLNFGQSFRGFYNAFEAVAVEFVGGGAGRASVERRPHRDRVIFLGYVLMDGVIGKAGQGRMASVDIQLDFIGSRMLLKFGEDLGGFVFV